MILNGTNTFNLGGSAPLIKTPTRYSEMTVMPRRFSSKFFINTASKSWLTLRRCQRSSFIAAARQARKVSTQEDASRPRRLPGTTRTWIRGTRDSAPAPGDNQWRSLRIGFNANENLRAIENAGALHQPSGAISVSHVPKDQRLSLAGSLMKAKTVSGSQAITTRIDGPHRRSLRALRGGDDKDGHRPAIGGEICMAHAAVEIDAVAGSELHRLIVFGHETEDTCQHIEEFLTFMTRKAAGFFECRDGDRVDCRMHLLLAMSVPSTSAS